LATLAGACVCSSSGWSFFGPLCAPALNGVQAASNAIVVHPPVAPRAFTGNLHSLPIVTPEQANAVRVVPEGGLETRLPGIPPSVSGIADPIRQSTFSGATETHALLSSPLVSFDGMSTGSRPMEPNGDVGRNHYVQMVNSQFQIFDKTGTSLAGPSAISSIWSSAGDTTECATTNDGDPIVLYDHLADQLPAAFRQSAST
jgi:hypothetical protein